MFRLGRAFVAPGLAAIPVFRESKSPNLFKVAKPLIERMIGANAFPGKGTMIADLVVISIKGLALSSVPYIGRPVNTFCKIDWTNMGIQVKLFEFWKQREIELGRSIRITDVARETGISRDTLTRLKGGKTKHPDLEVIEKLCKFFGVSTGPVPFIHYEADD